MGFAQSKASAGKNAPNILFIAIDDLRPELGCYGNKIVQTPNLDQLAKSSTVFLNAYCQQAVCSPSRTSVLTGLRPDSTKIWDLATHFRTTVPDVVTLPQYFKQHGYFSQCIGKIYHDPKWAQDSLSWSAPEIMEVTHDDGKYALDSNKNKGTNTKSPWKAAASEAADVSDERYIDGQVADAAVAFLKEKREIPFFLAVGFRRPHLPFSAPKKYWDLYDPARLPVSVDNSAPGNAPSIALHNSQELRGYRDIAKTGHLTVEKSKQLIHGYYASISYIDAQVGKLLEQLKSSGTFNNTIIVIWSDHGFHLGEKGLWTKTTNYELDARVPLVIKSAGSTQSAGLTQGRKSSSLVELVDLYPTLARMCDLPALPHLQGSSLAPVLADPTTKLKKAAFTQFPRPWQYKDTPRVMGYSLRTERYRYTEWQHFQTHEVIAIELYDHLSDPGELRNVSNEKKYKLALSKLKKMLQKGWHHALL
jgi:iduronate 2-sulfatase